MNQQTKFKPAAKKTTDCDSLFSGIWIRCRELTQSEKIVCGYITLIPLWWVWGWRLYFVFLVAGIIIHELREKREIRLQRPSAAVIGIIGYGLYVLIVAYFYREAQGSRLNFNAVISPINNIVCFGLLLWYVQDRKIRIRQQVVFWSFSIVIITMLLMWGVIYFGLDQANYIPPRSIYGLLT
ncbi:MAG: hypothetical protein ACFCUV_23465, partial [Rivularia sp. (in: cyanobacteria)]